MSATPAFKCLVAGCKSMVPAGSGGVQELFIVTHNRDAYDYLFPKDCSTVNPALTV